MNPLYFICNTTSSKNIGLKALANDVVLSIFYRAFLDPCSVFTP